MKGTRVVLAWLAVHLAACAFCQDVSGVLDRIRRGDANAIAEVVRVGPAAVPPILSVLDTARGDERLNLVAALTRIGAPLPKPSLEGLIEDPDPRIRIVVLTNLERLTDSSRIVSLLTRALGDPETSVATVALQQLLLQLRYRRGAENFFRAHPSLAPFLIPELASDDRTARMAAAYALLSAPMWEERYLQVIESENAVEPVAYLVSQHEAGAPTLANALIAKGTSGEPEKRIALLEVAVRYPTSESRAYVSQRLHDGDWRVRASAIRAASRLRLPGIVEEAKRLLITGGAEAEAAIFALEQLGTDAAAQALADALSSAAWLNRNSRLASVGIVALLRLRREAALPILRELASAAPSAFTPEVLAELPATLSEEMIRSLRQLAQEGNQAAFVALLVRRDPWAKQLALGVLREPHQISLPLLDAIATLQDAEFAAPLAEAYPKLDGYSQSRALLALLALGDSRALEQALQYPIQWSPQSREIRPYFHILQTLITTSRSSTVRKACLRLLAEPGASEGPFLSPETVALLVDLMGDADAIVRTVAKEYLLTRGLPTPLSAELADRIAAECLRDFDRSPDQERAQALQVLSRVWHSLGERHRQDAVEKSLKALWSVSPELQRAAVYALSWSSDPAVWNELLLLLYTSSDAKTSLLSAIANYDRLHGYTPQTALIPLLDDSNPYRWYAAAGQFHTEAAQRLIRRALEGDNEEDTIHALRLLLQRYGDTDVQHLAVRRARGLLSAGTEETRTLADAILLRYDPEYAYQRVSAALLDPSPSVRRSVLDRATALLRHPEAVALLMPIFERWDFDLQRIALISLSQIPGAQATDAIRRLTSHPEPGVRIFANQILLGRKG